MIQSIKPDKSSSRWVSEAFDNKKYAFAADYIRLYALYHYGGIYLDMDVEVLKSFNQANISSMNPYNVGYWKEWDRYLTSNNE